MDVDLQRVSFTVEVIVILGVVDLLARPLDDGHRDGVGTTDLLKSGVKAAVLDL